MTAKKIIEGLLSDLEKSVKASSCTFYIRDPIWKNGFRLAAMTAGVKRPEPMYGFSLPAAARDIISTGPRDYFAKNLRHDKVLREDPHTTVKIPSDKKPLFGDFVTREGVNCTARLIHPRDMKSPAEAVLFVNFKAPPESPRAAKQEIRRVFDLLTKQVHALHKELVAVDSSALIKSAQILSPDSTIAGESTQRLLGGPNEYLGSILDRAIRALGTAPGRCLGTLHLYNEEKQQLDLAAYRGPIDYLERAKLHSVRDGEGVISWVVLRRRAILIKNLNESDYKSIHVWLNHRVKSELAVPMISGERVIGVICLESLDAGAFVPSDVRALWYAANKAAVACKFYEQINISRRLLEVCSNATIDQPTSNPLDDLAAITKEHLDAALCDIWKYDPDRRKLGISGLAGASYTGLTPDIRPDGWSEYVRKLGRPVWLFNIRSTSSFEALEEIDGAWKKPTPGPTCPKSMNLKPIEQGVHSELGLPILSNGECVGVAWVKYRKSKEEPSAESMRLAKGFAAQVAMVLGVVQSRIRLKERRDAEEKIRENLVGKLDLSAIEKIEGYCASRAGGGILGGDCCRGIAISKHRTGILLLDGQGHGLRGSLNMLPLAGGFAALGEFASTTYIMEKLISIAHDVGVEATALYCIFTQIGERLFVSATCAGHPPIVLLRHVQGITQHIDIPNLNSPARGGALWEVTHSPVAEDVVELQSGDLLIGYTDGVYEGIERAQVSALGQRALADRETPKELAEAIVDAVVEGRKPDGQADDVTVFVIKVK